MKKQDEDDEDAEEACRDLRFDGCRDSMIVSVALQMPHAQWKYVEMLKHPIPALRPNCLLNSLNMFQFFLCLGPLFDSPLRWSRFVENDISEESSDRGHTCRGQDGQGWLDDEAGSLVRRIAINVRSLTVASCNTCNIFLRIMDDFR